MLALRRLVQTTLVRDFRTSASTLLAKKQNNSSNSSSPAETFNVKTLDHPMQSAIEHFKTELGKLRTGRVDPGLLDNIVVQPNQGPSGPLIKFAQVAVSAQTLIVNVYEASSVSAVEKAVRQSGKGLNPIVEGQLLKIPVPKLTTDVREEMAKQASTLAEAAKNRIRNVRRDTMQTIKKLSLPKDDTHRAEKDVQAVTKKAEDEIEKILQAKTNELKSR